MLWMEKYSAWRRQCDPIIVYFITSYTVIYENDCQKWSFKKDVSNSCQNICKGRYAHALISRALLHTPVSLVQHPRWSCDCFLSVTCVPWWHCGAKVLLRQLRNRTLLRQYEYLNPQGSCANCWECHTNWKTLFPCLKCWYIIINTCIIKRFVWEILRKF